MDDTIDDTLEAQMIRTRSGKRGGSTPDAVPRTPSLRQLSGTREVCVLVRKQGRGSDLACA